MTPSHHLPQTSRSTLPCRFIRQNPGPCVNPPPLTHSFLTWVPSPSPHTPVRLLSTYRLPRPPKSLHDSDSLRVSFFLRLLVPDLGPVQCLPRRNRASFVRRGDDPEVGRDTVLYPTSRRQLDVSSESEIGRGLEEGKDCRGSGP